MARSVLSPVVLRHRRRDVRRARRARSSPPCCRCSTPRRPRASRTWRPDRWARWRLADTERPRLAAAGHRVRARQAHLPGPAVLAVGDDQGGHAPVRRIRDDAHLDDVPDAGPGPDRRGGQGVRSRRGHLRRREPRLRAVSERQPSSSTGSSCGTATRLAVDGLSLTVEAHTITAVLGPNGAGKTTTLETCEGYRAPQARLGAGARARPAPGPARPAPPDRRDAPGGRRLERQPGRRDAPAHRRAARPPARLRDARGAARPRRLRPDAVPPPLGRPEAAARAGHGPRRPAGGRVRRRADRRARPGGASQRLGDHGGAPRPTARPSS